MNTTIVTFFGVGRIPFAPGTWGSLATLPFAWVIHYLAGGVGIVIVTLALIVIGYLATKTYLDGAQDDPKEVVIDEVVGQLIALWPLSIGLTMIGAEPHIFPWPGWVGAFVLFRFFDILKPPPIPPKNRV